MHSLLPMMQVTRVRADTSTYLMVDPHELTTQALSCRAGV